MEKQNHRTVWSSSLGEIRESGKQVSPAISPAPKQQIAYLHRESKGRAGKAVTLVKNLTLLEEDMKALAKVLKNACGSGGTVKDKQIEIQGEHRERIAKILREMGYKVKIAGG